MIPPAMRVAFAALNAGRGLIHKSSFQWDERLAAIAQELADFAWDVYQAGRYSQRYAHWQFLERGPRHGWTDSLIIKPPDAGEGTGNRGEYGVSGQSDGDAPKDRDGWRHPAKPIEGHITHAVELLTKLLPKNEGHVVDFRTSWTHAGIGYKEGIYIIEYGFITPGDLNEQKVDDEIKFYRGG